MTAPITLFPSISNGLDAELALLQSTAEDGAKRLLIWAAEARGLTLPERFSRVPSFADSAEALAVSGWPVTTRRTGGGITPQGPGIVNVAVAFRVPPKDARSVPESYAVICDPMVEVLAEMGVSAATGSVRGSFCDGDYNLEVEGRKLVGTAQRWRGATALCHALVLVDLDIAGAVAAAQDLSDALALGDTYRPDAHVRLSDIVDTAGRTAFRFAELCAATFDRQGFRVS